MNTFGFSELLPVACRCAHDVGRLSRVFHYDNPRRDFKWHIILADSPPPPPSTTHIAWALCAVEQMLLFRRRNIALCVPCCGGTRSVAFAHSHTLTFAHIGPIVRATYASARVRQHDYVRVHTTLSTYTSRAVLIHLFCIATHTHTQITVHMRTCRLGCAQLDA